MTQSAIKTPIPLFRRNLYLQVTFLHILIITKKKLTKISRVDLLPKKYKPPNLFINFKGKKKKKL